jgi:mRNA interferase RelE/StbE
VKPLELKPLTAGDHSRRLKVPDDMAERLRRMHPQLKRKIKESLKTILSDPGAGKSLRNELAGLQSFRVSHFRTIYRGKNKLVEIVAVGPLERIYVETYPLIKRERV